MTPATCNQRVEELSTQIKQLDEEREVLREKRQSLDLPAIKNDFLQEILVNLKGVVDAVPTPQKKHLLHLLVKKVLVCDRRTFEVWYKLPQFPGFRTLGSMVASTSQYAKQYHSGRERDSLQAIFRLSMTLPRISDPGNHQADFQLRLAGHPETIGSATEAVETPFR